MTRRTGLVLILLGLLTGCITLDPVADNTRFYLLPTPADSSGDAPDTLCVGLHPLSLPPYLDRREIVVQRGAAEIRYLDEHRWADGLAATLERSLSRHVQARAGVGEVVPAPWTSDAFDRKLKITIHACQGREDGEARLQASWAIQPGDIRNHKTLTGAYPPGDIPALVEELGNLVAQLAQAIGDDL